MCPLLNDTVVYVPSVTPDAISYTCSGLVVELKYLPALSAVAKPLPLVAYALVIPLFTRVTFLSKHQLSICIQLCGLK